MREDYSRDGNAWDYFSPRSRAYCEGEPMLLFTENESNNQRLFATENATPQVKDGVNEYLVRQHHDAVNPARTGAKSAAHYALTVAAGETAVIRLRLVGVSAEAGEDPVRPHVRERIRYSAGRGR